MLQFINVYCYFFSSRTEQLPPFLIASTFNKCEGCEYPLHNPRRDTEQQYWCHMPCAERTCVWGQAERNLFQQKLCCYWILYFFKHGEMAGNSTTEQTKRSSIPRPPKTLRIKPDRKKLNEALRQNIQIEVLVVPFMDFFLCWEKRKVISEIQSKGQNYASGKRGFLCICRH